jgi:hypothetical protein
MASCWGAEAGKAEAEAKKARLNSAWNRHMAAEAGSARVAAVYKASTSWITARAWAGVGWRVVVVGMKVVEVEVEVEVVEVEWASPPWP